jgi:thiamine transport system ATP-binding protein
VLELGSVSVRYGDVVAVDRVSLTVGDPGARITALLGPSGCGKSTLLRAIAGLERLSAGRIRFDGADLTSVPTHRRGFGMVFQDGQLFGHRDVAGNVGYGLTRQHWPRERAGARVDELLELVGLPGMGRRAVGELSGGQRQRVALARALAPRPRLLLLDEPFSALDRQLRDRLVIDIGAILRETDVPALIVTHDHREAIELADVVAVLEDGAVVQRDPPERLWRRPRTERVAAFLGYTSVIEAQVRRGTADSVLGQVLVEVPDGTFKLGLRPGSVLIQAYGVPAVVQGSVLTADGARIRVRVDTIDGPLQVDAVGDVPPPDGAAVRVALNPRRVAVIG